MYVCIEPCLYIYIYIHITDIMWWNYCCKFRSFDPQKHQMPPRVRSVVALGIHMLVASVSLLKLMHISSLYIYKEIPWPNKCNNVICAHSKQIQSFWIWNSRDHTTKSYFKSNVTIPTMMTWWKMSVNDVNNPSLNLYSYHNFISPHLKQW